MIIRKNQRTTPSSINMHPRTKFIGNFTDFLEWIDCTSICRTRCSNNTSNNFAFRLKMCHGFFECIDIHLRIFIDRNSHDRLEAHPHHCHILLHREVCIFRTNDFDVFHCFCRNTITLNRPWITIFIFPVFRDTPVTCKQYTHQVRLCSTRSEYTCLTCAIAHFLA